MSSLWHRAVRRFCTWLYFDRVTLIGHERLPTSGPILFIGLHRNGAVDGFVYNSVLPRVVFMVSMQLLRHPVTRLFFDGIPVVRTKDEGDRNVNAESMKACIARLESGGQLFIFPEGTSSLGPRHLPFKGGAAHLLLEYLKTGRSISVIPVAVHYERAWAFRSRVEVVVGEPILTELPADISEIRKLKELKRRMQAGLETVGINVDSAEAFEEAERLAYVATLATERSYSRSLKAMEQGVPQRVRQAWDELQPDLNARKLLFHQGVPLFPMGPRWVYVLLLVLLAPIIVAAALLNLLPLLAGWRAGRKLPDDRNVISFWRILVAVPMLVVWAIGMMIAVGFTLGWPWIAAYAMLSWLGLRLYYRFKKLAVAVHNGLRHPGLGPRLLAFRKVVLDSIPAE